MSFTALLNRWSLGRKLFTVFGLLLALGVTASTVAWVTSSAMKGRQDDTVQVAKRLQLTQELHTINAQIFGAEKNMILGGLTDDQKLIQEWTGNLQAYIDRGTAASDELVKAMPSDRERADAGRLKDAMAEWTTRCDACHAIAWAGGLKSDIPKVMALSRQSQVLMERNQKMAEAIRGSQEGVFKNGAVQAADSYRNVRLTIGVMGVVSLILALVVFIVVRGISRRLADTAARLRAGAGQVLAASSAVAGSSQSLSQGAIEQAAALEETSASMEEMSSMTSRNAENTLGAAALVGEVDTQVGEANVALEDMVASMSAIQTSSQQVSKIIRTIDEIAFQTNILALNAAVEAARAGTAGAGFAVVADEVRSLAQRSAQAARDTASLIEASIAKSEGGSKKVAEVAGSMSAITASVSRMKGLVNEVSEASRQQAQGIQQVTQALTQMEKVTQTAAATAEESAAASEELTSEADTTLRLVEVLDAIVKGGGSAAGLEVEADAPAQPDERPTARPALAA